MLTRSGNTGTATVAATVSNLGALTGDEYDLRYDGTNYSLLRVSDGSSVALSGAGTVASPLVADGISIVVSGANVAGNVFRIQPTRLGAQSLDCAYQRSARRRRGGCNPHVGRDCERGRCNDFAG